MRSGDRWVPLPEDALPGQYRVKDWLRMSDGSIVKIVARSTQQMVLRRVPRWRLLLRRWFGW